MENCSEEIKLSFEHTNHSDFLCFLASQKCLHTFIRWRFFRLTDKWGFRGAVTDAPDTSTYSQKEEVEKNDVPNINLFKSHFLLYLDRYCIRN